MGSNGGVIAAGSRDTAEAGAEILSSGGNAVDAAVAASFVSFISEIGLNHLGGSGIAQSFDPKTGESLVYDFFSTAPGLGRSEEPADVDFEEVVVSFGDALQAFRMGRGSVAVPGNVFGLCRMVERQGSLPLGGLLEPAIRLAEEGVFLDRTQTDVCKVLETFFTRDPAMREIFAPRGHLVQPGERLIVPHLASTLYGLAESGGELMRSGSLASAILDDQSANRGLLTREDLLRYEVLERDPIRVEYRDREILLPPPCSTGGALTAFSLSLASIFEVPSMDPDSGRYLQVLTEIQAATNRARIQWEEWVRSIPEEEAVLRLLRPEFLGTHRGDVRRALAENRPSPPVPEVEEPPHTTHISVVDSAGMAVSLTTSAGESAGYVVPGTGFIPNNMLGEADLHPHGFHRHTPGERLHTMMTPVIVLRDGRVQFVAGTGGSNRIRSATLQILLNLIDFGMEFQEAVDRPRLHLEDGVVQCEAGIEPAAMDELESIAYRVNRWRRRSIYFGGTHVVGRTASGELAGAGDRRRGGFFAKSR